MAKKKKIPEKLQIWIDARKKYRLSFKRFGKAAPDRVLSIEESLAEEQRKKQEKRAQTSRSSSV